MHKVGKTVQPKKMARGFKIQLKKVEELCYLVREKINQPAVTWYWSAPVWKYRGFREVAQMSHDIRKQVFGVSDQVRHKRGWAITEYGWRLEILDLRSRGIVLSL